MFGWFGKGWSMFTLGLFAMWAFGHRQPDWAEEWGQREEI